MLAASASLKVAAAGAGVEYDQYERMLSRMTHMHVPSGQVVFNQGDVPHSVYLITSGKLQVGARART